MLVCVLIGLGVGSGARALAQNGAQEDPLDAAFALLDSSAYAEAEAAFDALAEAHPGTALPLYYSGISSAALGAYDRSIRAFTRAAEIDPDFPFLQANLGIALYRSGQPEAAETHLVRAVAEDPEDFEALIHLALVDLSQGRNEIAVERFRKVAEGDRELAGRAWLHAAEALRAAGDDEAASEAAELAFVHAADDAVLARAEEMLEQMEAQRSPRTETDATRPWRIGLGAGLDYSSNVALEDTNFASGESDVAGAFDLDTAVRIFGDEDTELWAGYDFYQSVYESASDFDLRSHIVSLVISTRAGRFEPSTRYQYRHESLGDDTFLRGHQIGLAVQGALFPTSLPALHAQVGFEFEDLEFPMDSENDGQSWALDVRQELYLLDDRLILSVGYRPGWTNARDDRLSYSSHRVRVAGILDMGRQAAGLDLWLDYEFEHRSYDGAWPNALDPTRRDVRNTFGVGAALPLGRLFDLSLDYRLLDNDSDLVFRILGRDFEPFSYQEQVVTLRLGFEY